MNYLLKIKEEEKKHKHIGKKNENPVFRAQTFRTFSRNVEELSKFEYIVGFYFNSFFLALFLSLSRSMNYNTFY